MRLVRHGFAALCVGLAASRAPAQTAPGPRDTAAAVAAPQPADPPATLVYANRIIVTFRARMFSRTPEERAASAVQVLDRLATDTPSARVTTQPTGDAVIIHVGERGVFTILPGDVDPLTEATVGGTAAAAAARLELAFAEAVELHTPRRLLRAGGLALGATLLYLGLLWLLRRTHDAGARQLNRSTERQLEKLSGGAAIVRASHVPEYLQRVVTLVSILLVLVVTYAWATFVLRRFPYTRPLGESLRSQFVATVFALGERAVGYLPNLLAVLVILVATRFVVRLSNALFAAIEDERITVGWMHPATAQPTRRIVAALLWLLGIVISYPYLPGSNSAAFQGVSVFIGLMVSLGSSGIMNQMMSGLTIVYSRAVRVGDFVRIGEVEGTVEHLGVLSTKIKTVRREEITIPNALVVGTTTTNYSWNAAQDGVMVPTSLTIGYDTPWRQVEALLVLSAGRTDGIRREPAPIVWRTGLTDFYVEYTLLVCLEQPDQRVVVLDALYANILDAFNEYGVQITSPHYEADPAAPKVVPKELWYAAPAAPEPRPLTSPVAAPFDGAPMPGEAAGAYPRPPLGEQL
jgi:small-conductance mechanosensitive channel